MQNYQIYQPETLKLTIEDIVQAKKLSKATIKSISCIICSNLYTPPLRYCRKCLKFYCKTCLKGLPRCPHYHIVEQNLNREEIKNLE